MLIFSSCVFILTCHLFTGTECIKVDGEFLDRILAVHNSKLPCASQIVRFIDATVDKEDGQVYDEAKITLRGQMKNGDIRNVSLWATEVAPDGFRRTLVRDTGIFDKHYFVYTEVVPKMRDLMKAADDPSEPLFLDLLDAKNGSYVITGIPGRGWTKGFNDLEPTITDLGLAFRSLAKWHAMSAVLVEKGQIPTAPFAERLPTHRVNHYYTVLLENFAEVVRASWGKKWRQLAQQLKDTVPAVDQKLRSIFNLTNEENAFKVLNLGDFHWPNTWCNFGITDAHVTNHPIAIKFSSFEAAHINTPALDLHNVIYTSPNIRMALKYRDDLIKNVYYPALNGYLFKFGYGGGKLTLGQLEDELRRSELYGVIRSINFFSADVFGKEEVLERVDMIEESWKTGKIRSNMTGMLKKGFSDTMKPVMNHATDRHVFGRRDKSEEDGRRGSDSCSDSDSD